MDRTAKPITSARRLLPAALILSLMASAGVSQQAGKGVVLRALEEELQRAKQTLTQKGEQPPYLISYQVTEPEYTVIGATHGALLGSSTIRLRLLDVDVRVGDYQLDNTHRGGAHPGGASSPIPISVEDDPDALKSTIWLETDRRYKAALERLIQVKANRALKVQEEDDSADFSKEASQVAALPAAKARLNVSDWEPRVKNYSALFNRYPEIFDSSVTLTAESTTQYLANSEGTSLQHGSAHLRLEIVAKTKAEDGMELYRHEAFDAASVDHLPGESVIKAAIEKMAKDLLALRAAPVIDSYTGPAILSGRASGVFFHEIFGHRIEGHRQKDENEGQTFTKKVNQPVLPDFISVYDDPTLERAAGVDLNGHYQFDDEGVKAQRVTVVEKGVLKNFLMSRSPIKGFDKSNGHGRKSPGLRAVGRQGNLLVESSKTVPEAKLREMLIEECKQQGKPYGLIFQDISGGFTTTARSSPQAFQVTPIMVYRVYADGRPDELVRGVDLIGTPLVSFSKILASGDRPEVFNGVCGAESGWVPVATIAPSILTTQIEIQKKQKSDERPPILPPPSHDKAGSK